MIRSNVSREPTEVIGPETVLAAYLRYPLTLPDGRRIYAVETPSGFYGANELPMLRDDRKRAVALDEELAAGSTVRLALRAGLLHGVQIIERAWADPFAAADADI